MHTEITYSVLSRSIYNHKISYTVIRSFKTKKPAISYLKKLNDPKFIIAKKVIYYYE